MILEVVFGDTDRTSKPLLPGSETTTGQAAVGGLVWQSSNMHFLCASKWLRVHPEPLIDLCCYILPSNMEVKSDGVIAIHFGITSL